MTKHLYIRRAAALGGTTVDLAAYGTRKGAPFFDEDSSAIEMGMRCYEGEASQGEFILSDPNHDFAGDAFPSAHWLVTMTDTGPGFEAWLFRGRVANDDGYRTTGAMVDDETEWTIQVDDGNVELRGQAFTENWVRPAETDIQRLVALQLYTLNGASSTAPYFRSTCSVTINTSHLAPNANTVTMPAKKYLAGTQPWDVVKDCADTAGKQFGVVIHHTGGSHLCLLYTVNDDHTTYLSPAKISDELADWDPADPSAPVLEPHWETGTAVTIGMQTLLSGMVGVWGSTEQATFVEYAGVEDQTDYWVEAYHDGDSTAFTQVDDRTAGILEGRRNSHVTNNVSVILNPDQVDLIAAGMSIQIKSATNFEDATIYFTKRIAECRFEPRFDGTWWAHLNLERPPLRVAPGRGKAGPIPPVQSEPPAGATSDYLWTFTSSHYDDTTGLYPVGGGTSNSQWHPNYVHSHVLHPGIGNDSSSTKPPITPGTYHVRGRYGRMVGSPYNSGGVYMEVRSWDGATPTLIGTLPTHGYYDGTEYTIDVTVPAGADNISFGVPFNDSMISEVEISHGSETEAFVGTSPPPASTDPDGAIGTSPVWSPSDHQHPAQIAEVTPINDEGGYFEGGNVEEALQELGAFMGTPVIPPEILLESGHATPFTFDDILQESDGSDFLWASE